MGAGRTSSDTPYGPWSPGIGSTLPRELRPLATIFRSDNVFTDVAYAEELRDLTGLELIELATFRPQRLALHELLVRITADVSVPDGPRIEDLGIHFREITRTILERYVAPEMAAIEALYADVRARIAAIVAADVDTLLAPLPSGRRTGALHRLLFSQREAAAPADETERTLALIESWQRSAAGDDDPIRRGARLALARTVAALFARHGQPWGSRELIVSVATGIACNDAAGRVIGDAIDPLVARAAAREGYRLLRGQQQPVVMNTKGPSASGKSTLRPLQRTLAAYIGVDWSEFALISPDIWRKQLIDYASLGEHYKYAGAFTGDEVAIVDRKLDQHMARKAASGIVPHLLIDRFRFDSFAPDSEEAGSNLLTRFGHVVYLFFMITPPASLVERAWKRGLDVGRYKAVDDVLAHAVEAYSGMPQLFFTWVRRADKRVHFEFLDNSVPFGERPRTIAFGWNDRLNVLDVKGMLDIERYRRVDIAATSPQTLYRDPESLAAARNTSFLHECIARFAEVNFAEQASARIYARVAGGVASCVDAPTLRDALRDADTYAGIAAVAPALLDAAPVTKTRFIDVAERIHTVGRWGG